MKVYPPNKQFKSDSARLAFLVWVEFGVYGAQIKCRGRVLHTLIGRYVYYQSDVYGTCSRSTFTRCVIDVISIWSCCICISQV
ncbi:hypothetical protein CGJ63_16740 [Vibrio parahaemolyticus]|nr:hypothetical protein CGJ63_16740 [Vibrio parahaemolyticus]TOD78100.1 hypothetical protein CGJ58_17905 [Vibrio parahaemolyticus]